MASGYAFEKHLQNIQQLLLDPRNVPSNSSSNPATYSNPEENPEVSCNEEIEATLSFSNGPVALWKAYRDWVLLMVVHFEAVHTLRKFIRSASFDHKPINIQILLGTSVSREILPFDTYLRSSFFPGEPTENAALADFVAKSMSIKEQYIFATKALNYWENRSEVKVKYDTICSHISGMVKASRFEKTRHSEFETKTKKLLVEWDNSQKMKSSVYQELVANISKNFEEKVESLSEELAHCGPVADLQTHFCGTLHCEASLASILDPRTRESLAGNTDFKDLLAKTAGFGRILGVSKRSCPTCRHFLSLLSPDNRFITRGFHTTVSPCSLPTWTPDDIVEQMNETFGLLLRKELMDQKNEQTKKYRQLSTGSQGSRRLSVSSIDLQPDIVPTFAKTKGRPFRK